jgi:hypothetical protein
MGEYATHNGQSIKIGTCEDLYYLRFDQRHLVKAERNSVDVNNKQYEGSLRFRFPFPEEDTVEPGHFDDYKKSVTVPGYKAPETVEHYSIQFTNPTGYNLSVPCPEGHGPHPVQIHRNGWNGGVGVSQQKLVDGQLWTVCECRTCGGKWRCDEESGQAIATAFQQAATAEKARKNTTTADYYNTIADRILAGYAMNKPVLEIA